MLSHVVKRFCLAIWFSLIVDGVCGMCVWCGESFGVGYSVWLAILGCMVGCAGCDVCVCFVGVSCCCIACCCRVFPWLRLLLVVRFGLGFVHHGKWFVPSEYIGGVDVGVGGVMWCSLSLCFRCSVRGNGILWICAACVYSGVLWFWLKSVCCGFG